jgi:hypothetical protein
MKINSFYAAIRQILLVPKAATTDWQAIGVRHDNLALAAVGGKLETFTFLGS